MKQFVYAAVTGAMIFGLSAPAMAGGDFTDKRYDIKGNWDVVTENGQTTISFDEDFKTKKGPDLKIFLSPKSVETLTGQTATQGAIKLSVLKSNKGGQSYTLPANINLSDYESVIIHCEAFSVLWGGFDLEN